MAKTTAKTAPPPTETAVESDLGGGESISKDVRAPLEKRMGTDFSAVRVHRDVQLTKDLNANAFTVGTDIAFAPGRYQPASENGRQLLAHELTHVVQQSRAGQSLQCDENREGAAGDHAEAEAEATETAPAVTPQQAKTMTQQVLSHIKSRARELAAQPKTVALSTFVEVLKKRYLSGYLEKVKAKASEDTLKFEGAAAVAKVGMPIKAESLSVLGHDEHGNAVGDFWEVTAVNVWNNQPIPKALRVLRPGLPETLAAGTDILRLENVKEMPFIDVPQLVGKGNTSRAADADVFEGGKNISQLMHWATGVKYSDPSKYPENVMRELFFGYEMWHLEGWDVFAEDPINDMIAEEAGRLMGVRLHQGTLTEDNLVASLDANFAEARAWVGSFLKMCQSELDSFIVAEVLPKSQMWWGAMQEADLWGGQSVYEALLSGKSLDDVKVSRFVERVSGIYALIYESEKWQQQHGTIDHSKVAIALCSGQLDSLLEKIAKGEDIGYRDMWDILKVLPALADGMSPLKLLQVIRELAAAAIKTKADEIEAAGGVQAVASAKAKGAQKDLVALIPGGGG